MTVVALDTGALFGGLIITEKIFSIPGMGRFFYDALVPVTSTVIVAWLIVSAFFIILFNLLRRPALRLPRSPGATHMTLPPEADQYRGPAG